MILLLMDVLGMLVIFEEECIDNLKRPGWAVTAAQARTPFVWNGEDSRNTAVNGP